MQIWDAPGRLLTPPYDDTQGAADTELDKNCGKELKNVWMNFSPTCRQKPECQCSTTIFHRQKKIYSIHYLTGQNWGLCGLIKNIWPVIMTGNLLSIILSPVPITPVVSENFKVIRLTGTIKIGSFHMNVSITLEASSAGSSAISGVTINCNYDHSVRSWFFASTFRFWFDFCTTFPGSYYIVKSESRTL